MIDTDIRTLANSIYSIGPAYASGAMKEQLETLSREEFVEQLVQANQQRWESGDAQQDRLYAGSEQRKTPSSAEIAALANKYDPRNMDDSDYDDFLDDLAEIGAISQWEKRQLGYNNMVVVGYYDAEGKYVSCEPLAYVSETLPDGGQRLFHRTEANGDILHWVTDRLQWTSGGSREERAAQQKMQEMFQALSETLERMEGARPDRAGAEVGRSELRRQLADPDSDFYAAMRLKLQQSMEEQEEQEREQAIIDALGKILDVMSGGEDTKRSDVPRSATEIAQRISEYEPGSPERVQLEQLLRRLAGLGLYIDLAGLDSTEDNESISETLAKLLMEREAEGIPQ